MKFVSPGVALGALLLLGAGSAPAAAQKACVQCDSAEMRRSFDDAVRQLRSTVQALRARKSDTAMVRALRETDSVLRAFDPARARASHDLARAQRRLIESDDDRRDVALQRLVRQLGSLEAQLEMAHEMSVTMPSGYMGVTYSAETSKQEKGRELFIYHYDYPVVVSVEPGSPAEKSGLEAGDTIVAYNGVDVRNRGISLSKLLTPGTRVVVRVRREGAAKDLPVVVVRRPYRFSAMAVTMTAPEAMADAEAQIAETPGLLPRMRAPRPPRGPVAAAPPAPPASPTPVVAASPPFYLGGGTAAIAGAELVRMNEDLREVFGVERGLLVINVAEGTPAEQGGLRGGDVIVTVSGEPVGSVMELQRQLRQANERAVKIEVVRKKKTRTIVLRW